MASLRLLVSLLATLAWAPAWGLESAPVRTQRTVATLISDADTVRAGQPIRLALRLHLAAGWHTYWQNPGDAGVPAELTLALPAGATAGPIVWPAPARLPEGPVMTYGYTGEVVLPVTVRPGADGLPVSATATWLVCERICVPEDGTFRLDLPPGPPVPSGQAALFAAADAHTPRPSPFQATVGPDGTLHVQGGALSPETLRDAWFLPLEGGLIQDAAPQRFQAAPGGFTLALVPGLQFKPDKAVQGVIGLRDGIGQESFFTIAVAPGAAARQALPLAQLVLFGLLGGLILNAMPCVFPVLAMKAVSLARLSGRDRRAVRAGALSYTAGVLTTFALLGGALLALRAGGSAAGWAFQYQSPAFVAAMAWVLFVLGLNLAGVFQAGMFQVGAGLMGAGQAVAGRGGHVGSFFTGALAVVVATPCTAPFMGAAIAGALTLAPAAAILVFLALGAGLAAPYALLAAVPSLARLLPRPGPWMDVLRQAMAFPMFGAAAWLISVLSAQVGPGGVLAALAGMVLLGFAAWLLGLTRGVRMRRRHLGRAVAGAAALVALALLPGLATAPPAQAAGPAAAEWAEPYSTVRLAVLRAERRPVFVNMTAAWCITCLVNESVALSSDAVRQAFADGGVAYLKGDWTRADPQITAFLADHARDGVPLYVLYPADGGAPRVLPQLLTPQTILAQIGVPSR